MNIRPSAAIRQHYDEVSDFCRETGEPVYLTKNGGVDLVVMNVDAFEKREKMLALREKLLVVEKERLNWARYYSIEELAQELKNAIEDAQGNP